MNTDTLKKILPWTGVGVPGALAVLMLILGLVNDHAFSKVMLIISSVLLVLLAGVLYLRLVLLEGKKDNYFLVDPNTGKRISADKLTFAIVNERMNEFLAERIENENVLWATDFLLRRGIFGARDVFRPLTAYKMLFDLAEANDEESRKRFRAMPEDSFLQLTRTLTSVRDGNFAQRLMQLRQLNDDALLSDFISGNKRYIQGRMMQFVRANSELFDIEK